MGRNNLENKSKDVNWGVNLTQNKNFKFEILSEQACQNFELAQGLEMHKLTLAIRINANKFEAAINDKLDIKGRTFIVVSKSDQYDNPLQGRYKGSLKDFTASTILGLE